MGENQRAFQSKQSNLRHPALALLVVLGAALLATNCQRDDTEDGERCQEPDFEIEATAICPGESQPHRVFNAFWSAFDRHYALFDIRLAEQDWTALGQDACKDIDADMSDEALFGVLLTLARNFDDGHVQLSAPALDLEEDAWVSVYPHQDDMESIEDNMEARYLDAPLTYGAADEMAWGRVGTVGYLSLTSMDELSDSGDEGDDIRAASRAIETAMGELAGVQAMIVDVRGNGGGWDTVSLELTRWFAGPRTLAWSENRRSGPQHDDVGPFEDFFVEESVEGAFEGPVVLLTSGGTFSAAETFTLAMAERAQVTVLGERTSGHFSDLLETCLPNGWSLGLSGERYRAADGVIYEGQGAPVDVEVAFDPEAFAAGQDIMLEAALGLLAP